ncbi:MAG: trigger factor [Ruminococcaceae bacterium]|nr:trigger factor [Oscillospiraceae bacterium]
MKLIKNEQIEKNTVKLTIEVDKETFEKAIDKAYKKNVKQIALPGFRKGKAPRKIIEKYYGVGVFYEDAVNFICPDAYEFAVKESGIDPVDRPEIDIESIGEDAPLVITATVTVKPEVKLGEYKGIECEKVVYETKEEDIDAQIKQDAEKNVRLVNIEDRDVEKGDITTIDFEGFVDGVAFEGGKGTNHTLEIGSGQFIPGFEDQLIGAKLNVETEVNVTFPEEYHAEDLKGKPAVFKVTVKEIKVKEYPELDDDFAKDVSEFETFAEYKNSIKEKLDKSNEARTKGEYENKLVEIVTEASEVEIPQCMIDNRIEDMIKDFGYRLSSQGLNMEQYMQITGTTVDTFKEQFKDQAETQVKSNLVLEAIAKAEKVEVTDADVEEELKTMAEMYGMELDKVKTLIGDNEKESMKEDLKIRKAVAFIADNSKSKAAKAKAPAKKTAAKTTTAKKTTTKKTTEKADGEKAPAKKTATKTTTAKKTTTTKKAAPKAKAEDK